MRTGPHDYGPREWCVFFHPIACASLHPQHHDVAVSAARCRPRDEGNTHGQDILTRCVRAHALLPSLPVCPARCSTRGPCE